jgi:hypothetical protein
MMQNSIDSLLLDSQHSMYLLEIAYYFIGGLQFVARISSDDVDDMFCLSVVSTNAGRLAYSINNKKIVTMYADTDV